MAFLKVDQIAFSWIAVDKHTLQESTILRLAAGFC